MGTLILGGTVDSETSIILPKSFSLSSFPNPARGGVLIKYTLPRECKVELKIYNLAGQIVRTIVDKREKEGYKEVYWDRKDNYGRNIRGGIYFCRLNIDNSHFVETKKLIIFRK
jgi:hypothetical protein